MKKGGYWLIGGLLVLTLILALSWPRLSFPFARILLNFEEVESLEALEERMSVAIPLPVDAEVSFCLIRENDIAQVFFEWQADDYSIVVKRTPDTLKLLEALNTTFAHDHTAFVALSEDVNGQAYTLFRPAGPPEYLAYGAWYNAASGCSYAIQYSSEETWETQAQYEAFWQAHTVEELEPILRAVVVATIG